MRVRLSVVAGVAALASVAVLRSQVILENPIVAPVEKRGLLRVVVSYGLGLWHGAKFNSPPARLNSAAPSVAAAEQQHSS